MAKIEKTVFISYRHTNWAHARAIREYLKAKGYDVFIDVEDIRTGKWLDSLLNEVPTRGHFILILTNSAIERLQESNSILRQEYNKAIETNRNIIPVTFEKSDISEFSEHLTGHLAQLAEYQEVLIQNRFWKASMKSLENALLTDRKSVV